MSESERQPWNVLNIEQPPEGIQLLLCCFYMEKRMIRHTTTIVHIHVRIHPVGSIEWIVLFPFTVKYVLVTFAIFWILPSQSYKTSALILTEISTQFRHITFYRATVYMLVQGKTSIFWHPQAQSVAVGHILGQIDGCVVSSMPEAVHSHRDSFKILVCSGSYLALSSKTSLVAFLIFCFANPFVTYLCPIQFPDLGIVGCRASQSALTSLGHMEPNDYIQGNPSIFPGCLSIYSQTSFL